MKGLELTGCNYVVHHQDLLPLLDSITLNLKEILTVLLVEARLLGRAGQFTPLPNRSEASTESQGETGTEEKPPCVEAHYNVWLDAIAELEDL